MRARAGGLGGWLTARLDARSDTPRFVPAGGPAAPSLYTPRSLWCPGAGCPELEDRGTVSWRVAFVIGEVLAYYPS